MEQSLFGTKKPESDGQNLREQLRPLTECCPSRTKRAGNTRRSRRNVARTPQPQVESIAKRQLVLDGEKFILDACCGGRMMWIDKQHPNTVYIDNRVAEKGHIQKGFNPGHCVKPDIVMDFRRMDFADKTFKLVVFDPPHLSSLSPTSIMRKKFGSLDELHWGSDLKLALNECWRVLDDYGILIFKWNDIEIPYKRVLELVDFKPLIMNITAGQKALKQKNRSYWFTFMKIPKHDESKT